MGESLLKKEFAQKDVNRLRALISKNYGASTQTLVGHEKKWEDHKEGETWEEDGKVWKIEDGIKISVPRLQKARNMVNLPLVCPKCGKALNTRLDKKFFPLYGTCYDCVVRFEDDLKRAGLYKEYEQNIVNGNIDGFVQDLKDRVNAMAQDLVATTVSEQGEIERWGEVSKDSLTSLKDWIKEFENRAKN